LAKALRALVREELPGGGVYSFPFFTESFCEQLLAEVGRVPHHSTDCVSQSWLNE
jgi:hypothetical protein